MKNKIFLSLTVFIAVSSFITVVSVAPLKSKVEKQLERKIVVFKDNIHLNGAEEDNIIGGFK